MAVKLGNGNWAVKEDKLLAYNDNSGLFFNKEFDFSRGTSATYVAKDGLIKTAGIQPNIVTNGDFSDGSTDWNLGTDWTVADGKATYGGNANGNHLSQSNLFTVSGRYRVKFTISDIASGNGRIYMSNAALSEVYLGLTYVDNQSYSFDFDATATNDLVIRGYISGGGQSFSISNITVQQIETDTPRIDFTNDTKGHLLLEPQSTNVIINSNSFNGNANVVVETDNTISPDGNLNGSKITANSGTSLKLVDTNGAASNTYIFSVFAKKGTHNIIQLGGGGVLGHANFNLETGEHSSLGSMLYYANGWYRCSVQFSAGTPTSHYVSFSDDINANRLSTSNSDGNIFLYGMQSETNYITSYIPTTGATSTRNADVCNNSGSAQDFNSEEGVLYFEGSFAQDGRISLSDGTTSNRITIRRDSSSNLIRVETISGGVFQGGLGTSYTDSNTIIKLALKYKENDTDLYANGLLIGTDSTYTIPTNLNDLSFDGSNGSDNFYGKVRNVQVFTEALTDEQLEKLTS